MTLEDEVVRACLGPRGEDESGLNAWLSSPVSSRRRFFPVGVSIFRAADGRNKPVASQLRPGDDEKDPYTNVFKTLRETRGQEALEVIRLYER